MRGDGESKAHIHAAGIIFDRSVYELFGFGEGDYLIKFPVYLTTFHAENCAVQIDILPPAQLRMKTGANLEQAANAAVNVYLAGRRFGNAGKNFEQCRFACTFASDHSQGLTWRHFKADIFQRPNSVFFLISVSPKPAEPGAQRSGDRIAECRI